MENSFLSDYFSKLEEYNSIPKLQIERAISPLLSVFIEELIKEFLINKPELSGEIELILPEFPLKKENNQSTNIDWLLVNKEKQILLFVELKTATTSFNSEQLDTYVLIQKYIQKFGAKFLYDDIKIIRNNSSEKNKYDFILQRLSAFHESFRTINRSEIIYIVPTAIKHRILDAPVLTFSDFPEYLNHNYQNEWRQLRKFFLSIDKLSPVVNKIKMESSSKSDSSIKLKLEIIARKFNKTPVLIWFGKTGDGSNPNFQIKFTDGSIQPFYHSGKEYTRRAMFDANKLRGPYEIKKILEEN